MIPRAARALNQVFRSLREVQKVAQCVRASSTLWEAPIISAPLRESLALEPIVPTERRVLVRAADIPTGQEPREGDDLLFDGQRWRITVAQHETAQAGWVLTVRQIG